MQVIIQKLKTKKGATLTELLVSIVVLILVGACFIVCFNTAQKSYEKITFAAESGVLMDTVNTEIDEVLRYSDEVSEENGVVKLTNLQTYTVDKKSYYKFGIVDGSIESGNDGRLHYTDLNGNNRTLVSNGIYHNMKIKDFSLSYNSGIYQYEYTITSSDGLLTKEVGPITVRQLN